MICKTATQFFTQCLITLISIKDSYIHVFTTTRKWNVMLSYSQYKQYAHLLQKKIKYISTGFDAVCTLFSFPFLWFMLSCWCNALQLALPKSKSNKKLFVSNWQDMRCWLKQSLCILITTGLWLPFSDRFLRNISLSNAGRNLSLLNLVATTICKT